ncbi:MAG: bifunctional glycosyltransferase family 2/GtrA family protein [Minisyncoccia bacterium]|jgi:glycosyltransferase involved in cell wall biosynthesis
MDTLPYISVVIPVYNEEEIIVPAVEAIVAYMQKRRWTHEILLVENGSQDATWPLIKQLERRYISVRGLRVGEPGKGDYGLALKSGSREALGEFVVNDDIDIGNFDFYSTAINILARDPAIDMVIGSKALAPDSDKRPALRHAATRCINILLRVLLGFKGTDTHGLKIWRRTSLEDTVRQCVTNQDFFSSELVIRAERAGKVIKEIPIVIEEKRQPRVHIVRRVPRTLKNLFELFVIFRLEDVHVSYQVVRYGMAAVISTLLNAAMFNLCIFASGITRGPWIFVFSLSSYALAIINGFLWNKYWVFKHKAPSTWRTYSFFVGVTVSTAILSSALIYVFTTFARPYFFSPHLWANIIFVAVLPLSFSINYLGNKYLVFINR